MLDGAEAASELSVFGATVRESSAEGDCRRLTLAVQQEVAVVPGQFLGVRVSNAESSDPLLMRPLSVADWLGEDRLLQLIVKPVGRGTRYLCRLQPGATIDCLGPLGNGFPLHKLQKGKAAWIVGGGIGMAPLLYLARVLAEKDMPPVTFLGAAGERQFFALEEFSSYSTSLHLATDDGSAGFKGVVTQLVRQHLELAGRPGVMYCCGPDGMLLQLAEISQGQKWTAYGSLEEYMACGVGACLGCAVPAASGGGYLQVCSDGPVFNLREVLLHD